MCAVEHVLTGTWHARQHLAVRESLPPGGNAQASIHGVPNGCTCIWQRTIVECLISDTDRLPGDGPRHGGSAQHPWRGDARCRHHARAFRVALQPG